MKILYLHQYFATLGMPGPTRSYEVARRFAEAGHEVHVITSWRRRQDSFDGWKHEMVDGIHVHWLAVPYSNALSYGARIWAFFRFALRCSARAWRIGGDVVFATSTPLTIAVPALVAKRVLGVPMVFEVRDLWPKLPIAFRAIRNPLAIGAARWLEALVYRKAARIVAFTPAMQAEIAAMPALRERAGSDKVVFIPNGCDNALFRVPATVGAAWRAQHLPFGEGPLCVYAGALGLANDAVYLVEIARRCLEMQSKAQFLVIGEGAEEDRIRQHAIDCGVMGQNFHLMPVIAKAHMPALLSATTMAVAVLKNMEIFEHSFGNKGFDALAAGRPIMINYGGWHADLIRETGAGIVIPPDDPKVAADMLCDFLADEERLARAGRAAAEVADSRFGRDMIAGQLLELLSTVVAEAKNRA